LALISCFGGGWAVLAVVGWLVLRRKTHLCIGYLVDSLIYIAASAFVFGWCWAVIHSHPTVLYSLLCVCLAIPVLAHLNWWIEPLVYHLLVLMLACYGVSAVRSFLVYTCSFTWGGSH